MVVLVCRVQLYLSEARSLKHKRQIVSSLKERLHNRFHLSVAEVEHQDLWQRCGLALAVVASDGEHADRVVDSAVRFIEADGRVQLLDVAVEER